MTPLEYVTPLRACTEGRQWVEGYTSFTKAWNECNRADWMTWVLYAAGLITRRQAVSIAACCTRRTLEVWRKTNPGVDEPFVALAEVEKWVSEPDREGAAEENVRQLYHQLIEFINARDNGSREMPLHTLLRAMEGILLSNNRAGVVSAQCAMNNAALPVKGTDPQHMDEEAAWRANVVRKVMGNPFAHLDEEAA